MFIQVIEGRTSDAETLRRRLDVWEEELRPGAIGYLGSAGGCTDDGSFILAARFEDRSSAMRNSQRAEQAAWWTETEKCMDGPARFHDTEDVHVMTHGRLDDANFVQVMEGHVLDRSMAEQLEHEAEPVLADVRPDLLGAITAYFTDDDFTDIAFFTNEREARANEKREMPPEMAEKLAQRERAMKVERYMDISNPWLTTTA